MNVHKFPFTHDEAPAVDPLDDGGADREALIADFDEAQRAFTDLRRGVFDLHHTLIKRARFHRRAECRLRRLAASVIEAANEY